MPLKLDRKNFDREFPGIGDVVYWRKRTISGTTWVEARVLSIFLITKSILIEQLNTNFGPTEVPYDDNIVLQ